MPHRRLGGHGGRGHQVSRKTVRQRRAAGIQPKRGHNFDHRLRNVERLQAEVRDAKAYQTFDPETLIASLLAKARPSLRDDIGQELWVLALQGATEPELRAAYLDVRIAVAKIEWGDPYGVSLDEPLRNKHGVGFEALGANLDTVGLLRHRRIGHVVRDSWEREGRRYRGNPRPAPTAEEIHSYAVALGRRGGLASGRNRVLTPEQRSDSAQRAAIARWSNR